MKAVQQRVENLITYFKSNPRSATFQKMVAPAVSDLDDMLAEGYTLEQLLKDGVNYFCIVYGTAVPYNEKVRFNPDIYDTEVIALENIVEDNERVVSYLEYVEMCVEYEKNHKR